MAVTAGVGAADRGPCRELAGERIVQRHAECVFVGPRVAAPAGELLRRRIVGRADETAGLGHGLLPGQPCRAEVGEPCPAVGREQDVLRLDVAMEDAVAVGGGERRGDLTPEACHGVGVERPALSHAHGEVGARDILHHDETPRPVVDDVVHGDDVRVAELPHRLNLAAQPLAREPRRGGRGHQQLDRHVGTDATVARAIYDREAAAPDLIRDLVAILQDDARSEIGGLGHHRPLSANEDARARPARSASSHHSRGSRTGRP